MKFSPIHAVLLTVCGLALPGCLTAEGHSEVPHASAPHDEGEHSEGEHGHRHKILVTTPLVKDVITTEPWVCQIHSRRHIEVRSLEGGYLQEVHITEGQAVKEGDLMFKIYPVVYKARRDTEMAEALQAQIEFDNTKALYEKKIVSNQELMLVQAKLNKANAKLELANAELSFTDVRAPFPGIVDRQQKQQGSLIEEGEILSTLSDNQMMWVYFNVPERAYLDYKERLAKGDNELQVELKLANGKSFPHPGKIGAIEADFNNETGNIAFRADFPNPEALLRHGQTGTVLIHRPLKNALVIPQRAKFEILAKQYVFVVDDEGVVHQRDITVQSVMDDIFVIKDGLTADDRIVFEGVREVRDGDKVDCEFRDPVEILSQLKNKAE